MRMADLADQIDDFICSFEGAGDLTMDTLAMLIFVWAIVALFVLWLCKFLYNKYVKKSETDLTKTAEVKTKPEAEKIVEVLDKSIENGSASESVKNVEKSVSKVAVSRVGGGKKSTYVPPTPPMRKRLSRKSPGPELGTKKSIPIQVPLCTGADPQSVLFVNEGLHWLYSDQVIVYELLAIWVQAMNDYAKKAVEEHGVGVELIRVLPETPAPVISNVFAENLGQETSITMDIETTPVLQLKAFRQKGGKVDTAHYRVNVNRFRGRLSAKMAHHALKGELKPEGWPEVRLSLASIGAIRGTSDDENQLQELISEIVTSCLRSTTTPLDFSIYPTYPRYKDPQPPSPVRTLPLHYDSMTTMDSERSTPLPVSLTGGYGGRRLLVKLVRADGLGGPSPAREPYCVVEMDEPPQKNQTGSRTGPSPFWDEHFLFDLSPSTAELLFEVYDKPVTPSKESPNNPTPSPRFLGLGLVGVDELSVGPSSSQILTLQPKPYENGKAFGAITVEFVFIEGAEVPAGRRPYKLKEALHLQGQRSPTHNTYNDSLTNGNVDLADSAIRAIESGVTAGPNANKSTLIIHSVHRQMPQRQTLKVEMTEQGSFIEVEPKETTEPPSSNEEPGDITSVQNNTNGSGMQTGSPELTDDRGRGRRKRDFFGTIKRRLGRSKNRSKSMDRATAEAEAKALGPDPRSISADRGVLNNSPSGPRLLVPDGSRRSSISEGSAISGASTRTYVNEASTLVLETLENGVRRHFLVPIAVAQRPRWRRKGTKLHIYNDHTFVAKHLSGGLPCGICNRSITRRPGKQGYECRDCFLRCHKQCHVRAPQVCPNPTVLSIELSLLPVLSE